MDAFFYSCFTGVNSEMDNMAYDSEWRQLVILLKFRTFEL